MSTQYGPCKPPFVNDVEDAGCDGWVVPVPILGDLGLVYGGRSFGGWGGSAHPLALFTLQKVWPLIVSTINSLFNKSYSEIEL